MSTAMLAARSGSRLRHSSLTACTAPSEPPMAITSRRVMDIPRAELATRRLVDSSREHAIVYEPMQRMGRGCEPYNQRVAEQEDVSMDDAVDPKIVGIGASAGGVHTLQTLFQALPDDTDAAFVIVVH